MQPQIDSIIHGIAIVDSIEIIAIAVLF